MVTELKDTINIQTKTIERLQKKKQEAVPDNQVQKQTLDPQLMDLLKDAMNIRLTSIENAISSIQDEFFSNERKVTYCERFTNTEVTNSNKCTNTSLPYPMEDERLTAIQESIDKLIQPPRIVVNVGMNTLLPSTIDVGSNTDRKDINANEINR